MYSPTLVGYPERKEEIPLQTIWPVPQGTATAVFGLENNLTARSRIELPRRVHLLTSLFFLELLWNAYFFVYEAMDLINRVSFVS